MKRIRLVSAAAMVLVAACDRSTPAPADTATPAPTPPPPAAPAPVASAPATFKVRLETSRGPIVIEANREWSPNGVDRFYQLVEAGYYGDVRFFRVVPGFVV